MNHHIRTLLTLVCALALITTTLFVCQRGQEDSAEAVLPANFSAPTDETTDDGLDELLAGLEPIESEKEWVPANAVTIKLPVLAVTNVNTIVSVPDGETWLSNGIKRRDFKQVKLPQSQPAQSHMSNVFPERDNGSDHRSGTARTN